MSATKPIDIAFSGKWSQNESGCHIWHASVNNKGYGQIRHKNVCYLAHRISWVLAFGEIPEGKIVLHECDTPACVNPLHLKLGTKKENTQDMMKKKRNRCGRFSGIAHPSAKLNDEKVREIRNDMRPQRDIAKSYGISQTNVGSIKRRETWGHVP